MHSRNARKRAGGEKGDQSSGCWPGRVGGDGPSHACEQRVKTTAAMTPTTPSRCIRRGGVSRRAYWPHFAMATRPKIPWARRWAPLSGVCIAFLWALLQRSISDRSNSFSCVEHDSCDVVAVDSLISIAAGCEAIRILSKSSCIYRVTISRVGEVEHRQTYHCEGASVQ
ncbi:uncharacterized protein K489DRAFT_108333 [Dissoconium aciculare CBS 342.82]|uniref:Uncharacterized protein n=1 Tax=Dissoconium aciculare CBS 342.82 TaxID=1314786 RepID=A0A6J3MGX1_9PEZI|nr:uncharacterized protein K489DRAFT_108333 [Dissoconium aciculare CBS 342.82]KAF1826147.1 hypothetical protein K489DRAFT_108333 [Dissoconium aciculare CBS 342.82]